MKPDQHAHQFLIFFHNLGIKVVSGSDWKVHEGLSSARVHGGVHLAGVGHVKSSKNLLNIGCLVELEPPPDFVPYHLDSSDESWVVDDGNLKRLWKGVYDVRF